MKGRRAGDKRKQRRTSQEAGGQGREREGTQTGLEMKLFTG